MSHITFLKFRAKLFMRMQAKLAVESAPFMWDPVALAEMLDDDGGSLRIGSRNLMEQARPRTTAHPTQHAIYIA